LAVILLLWLLIVATMVVFARVDRRATVLLVPYLLWVSFATYLNYQFWLLN
jgi:tryptophan-rich sensory protein